MYHIDNYLITQSPRNPMLPTTFRTRKIGLIDSQWQAVFDEYWPAYESWYRRKKGGDINPGARKQGYRQLAMIMPEMLPLYESFLDTCNDCPVAAQFLTGYQPPAYLVNCSQAVLLDEEPLLIRNYDLSPDLSENLLTHSNWLGQDIIGSNECLWGLDDGMNESGLAASLTFGGSSQVGKGFGIPFIMRYLLQTCENVRQAISVLQRVPSHMAYNVTLVDKQGSYATVMLAPGQEAKITRERCTTNHQSRVTWRQQATFTNTVERKKFLDELMARDKLSENELRRAFLAAPLRSTNFGQNFGTVYTAVFKPSSASMSYHWPDEPTWRHGFADFEASEMTVNLDKRFSQATVHGEINERAEPDHCLTVSIRRQLLQGLTYLPVSAVGQPDALQNLKRDLQAKSAYCWQDYARQVAQVWRYPAPANQPWPDTAQHGHRGPYRPTPYRD
jgi:predicted choloylglycine hydrolase